MSDYPATLITKPLTLRKPLLQGSASPAVQTLLGVPALLAGALLMPQAHAEDDAPIMLDTMQIEERTLDTNPYAEEGAPYKARVSGDSRHVKPLAETPQTITVLTQTQIQESGRTDLKDILAAQPGISLGTGENGNAFGDRYIIRGHEARSDVFVDGLKDPGMTTRESFAVEQIEVTKGPSSTFAGRGSTGGAINSITKQASTEYDFNKVSAGIGTDNYRRATLDSNYKINDDLAVRANVLHAYTEVPDRAPADKERNGAALSATWQTTHDLKLIADYYHLQAFDQPDLGTYINRSSGQPNDDMPVYLQDEDFLKSRVDTFTLRAEYEVSDKLKITNAMRHGTTNNGYYVTGASGTSAYDAATADAVTDTTATYSTIGTSSHQGWQEVEYFANQLNAYIEADIGDMKHQFVVGAEYSKHDVLNGVYTATSNGETNCIVSGRGGVQGSYCLLDENGNEVDNINSLLQRDIQKGTWDSNYQISTLSMYLMDTIEITDDLSVFAGIRADQFDYRNVTQSTSTLVQTPYEYNDTLWNGHIGSVYQITGEGNVYLTMSTSANINGGESDVGSSCGYGGICGGNTIITGSKPEKTRNLELGTKWNLFNDKLLATAALFRIDKKDVMEQAADSSGYDSAGQLNTGANRVRGGEIGLTGNLTDKLSTQFGFALMKSEITDSATDASIGGRLAGFADRSGFAQLRYQATDTFSFGGTATHSSEVYVGQPDSPAGTLHVPAWTVFDAFASYKVNERLNTRLNIKNLADKDYYLAAYRSGSFTYIGDARNAQLTVEYEF
jgi:catecholate siderophore receptor